MTYRSEVGAFHGVILLSLVSIFCLVGARWIWVYRFGQPFDIDEAGYLSIALNDYGGFVRGGLIGWLSAIQSPSIQAPLTTALASLVFIFTGPHVIAGFSVPLAAGAGCIIVTYFLGKSLDCPRVGLLASILVASCPVTLNLSRGFHFAMPAAFVMTFIMLALVKSKRFDSAGWTALFGLSLGMLPLARTMTIAFIPGIVAGAFVYVISEPSNRLRRLLMLSGSFLLAALVTASWLVPNGRYVFGYLLSFGYGAQAAEYGAQHTHFGPDAWLQTLRVFSDGNVYLPHLVIIFCGWVIMFVVFLRRFLQTSNVNYLYYIIKSPTFSIILIVIEAFLALTSSRNKGFAFFAPIVPALIIIAVLTFDRVSRYYYYRLVTTGLFIGVAAVAAAPLLDLRTPISPSWSAKVPILGGLTVTDGRGTLQLYEAYAARCEPCSNPERATEPVDPVLGRAWINVSERTASMINRAYGTNATMAWGFRHHLYNVNTVNLQELLRTGVPFRGRQIEPTVTGESVDGYLSWITREALDSCVLLTSDKAVPGHFFPAVNPVLMREAAESAGLVPDQQLPTPDGQIVTLWKHKTDDPCR